MTHLAIKSPSKRRRHLNSLNSDEQQSEGSLRANLHKLRKNMSFFFMCISLTGLYFVVTGIQYWIPTYFQKIYGLTPDMTTVLYTVICITGPISGVIIGGIVTTAFGGYNTKSSHKL